MLDKNKYLEIIKSAIRPPGDKIVWKNDPFDFLLNSLKETLAENHLENMIPRDSEVASTSSTPESEKILNSDARLEYAHALGEIYLELSKFLGEQKLKVDDEYRLLSLQDLTILCESLQFFVLTAVLPFLKQGVGLGASSRSNFVKSWKLYDGNIGSQRENLSFAANVIIELIESNEALKNQVINKFIDDLYAIKFQLSEIEIKEFEEKMEKIVDFAPKNLRISSLMGLIKQKMAPKWIQIKCGEELSRIQMEKDGVFQFLAYYSDIGGDNWVENVPLCRFVAQQFVRRPKNVKSLIAYHSNIFRQFMDIIESCKEKDKNYRNLMIIFVTFIEEMQKISQYNADLVVFDMLFRFWEIVHEKMTHNTINAEQVMDFNEETLKNLKLIEEMLIFGNFKVPERLLKIFPVILNISEEEKVSKSAKIIAKSCLKNISNPGAIIYAYVMNNSRKIRVFEKVEQKKVLIEEVGEEKTKQDFQTEMWIDGLEEEEIGVARRLEHCCEKLEEICEKEQIQPILLEMLAHGVENWMDIEGEDEKIEEEMRFVKLENGKQKNSLHAHLVVGFCFEKLGTVMTENGFFGDDENQFIILLRIVETVLQKSTKKLKSIDSKMESMDIFKLSETDSLEIETMLETLKMSIGLTGGVLVAASFYPQIIEKIEDAMKIMSEFLKVAKRCYKWEEFGEKLEKIGGEAERMLKMMDCEIDIEATTSTERVEGKKKERSGDICQELLEDLENEEAALCGSSLIQISRIFKNKNEKLAQKLMEESVFEKVEELLSHKDSYVFLAAINCLGEIALYEREYLKKLLELYGDWKTKNGEEVIIRRGRIGEVLGKIFRQMGEISLFYLDQVMRIFVQGLREEEEIIRASCCTSLGDIIVASRGRGIQKWMDEVLYILNSVILIDKAILVRRSAVDLIRQIIRSTSTDVLQVLGDQIRDIRRKIMELWKYDRDEVVRLHAQLCMEEINSAIREIFEEENSRYCRTIII